MNKCLCGCGQEVRNKFVSGRNARVNEYSGRQFKKGSIPWDIRKQMGVK